MAQGDNNKLNAASTKSYQSTQSLQSRSFLSSASKSSLRSSQLYNSSNAKLRKPGLAGGGTRGGGTTSYKNDYERNNFSSGPQILDDNGVDVTPLPLGASPYEGGATNSTSPSKLSKKKNYSASVSDILGSTNMASQLGNDASLKASSFDLFMGSMFSVSRQSRPRSEQTSRSPSPLRTNNLAGAKGFGHDDDNSSFSYSPSRDEMMTDSDRITGNRSNNMNMDLINVSDAPDSTGMGGYNSMEQPSGKTTLQLVLSSTEYVEIMDLPSKCADAEIDPELADKITNRNKKSKKTSSSQAIDNNGETSARKDMATVANTMTNASTVTSNAVRTETDDNSGAHLNGRAGNHITTQTFPLILKSKETQAGKNEFTSQGCQVDSWMIHDDREHEKNKSATDDTAIGGDIGPAGLAKKGISNAQAGATENFDPQGDGNADSSNEFDTDDIIENAVSQADEHISGSLSSMSLASSVQSSSWHLSSPYANNSHHDHSNMESSSNIVSVDASRRTSLMSLDIASSMNSGTGLSPSSQFQLAHHGRTRNNSSSRSLSASAGFNHHGVSSTFTSQIPSHVNLDRPINPRKHDIRAFGHPLKALESTVLMNTFYEQLCLYRDIPALTKVTPDPAEKGHRRKSCQTSQPPLNAMWLRIGRTMNILAVAYGKAVTP